MFQSIAGDLEGNLKDKLTLLSTDMRDPCCDKFVLTAMPLSHQAKCMEIKIGHLEPISLFVKH